MRDNLPFARVLSSITRSKDIVLNIVKCIVEVGLQEAVSMAHDILELLSFDALSRETVKDLTLMLSGCATLT
jgi:hypothetical protein